MEKQRHQREPDEIFLMRWVLGGVLALLAGCAAFWFDMAACVLFALMCVLVVAALWRPTLAARWRIISRRAILPLVAIMLAIDVIAGSRSLPALARVVMLLLLYRAINFRSGNAERQLIGLGLLLIILSGVASESWIFPLHLALFASGALLLFYETTLTHADERRSRARLPLPSRIHWKWCWRALLGDWREWLPGVSFLAVLATGGILLYGIIPHATAGNFPLMERFFERRTGSGLGGMAQSGFSESLRFDSTMGVRENDSVAFRVDLKNIAEIRTEGRLYWRMIVLDDYRNREFQLSASLRRAAFGERQTSQRIVRDVLETRAANRNERQWMFYVEPGVGNFLPLPENFEDVAFAKPHEMRVSNALGIVDLDKTPRRMIAYRATSAGISPAQRPRVDVTANAEHIVRVSESDRARLTQIAEEIRGGRAMADSAFAKAASAWIGARHAYALSSTHTQSAESSAGDPLVAWLRSREPGHCELFAGSLALLMREAGYRVRVVAGFVGGELNQDYLVVRNSRAHAWCEFFDSAATPQTWTRIDPTLWAGGAQGDSDAARSNMTSMRQGWDAWLDRLRMNWARYTANVDDDEARALSKNTTTTAAIAALILVCIAFAFLRHALQKHTVRQHAQRGKTDDFSARQKAARWLRKLGNADENDRIVENLLRVRYGRKTSWPELRNLWRDARRAARTQRVLSKQWK